ncbi:MAG: RES family NAD+ phosphorylase [Vulcanimicrobiaceae bacterium]
MKTSSPGSSTGCTANLRVFRVFDARFADASLTGEGAALTGGRWNSRGIPIIYTSTTLALALLEIMANARRRIPPDKVFTVIDIPEDVSVENLDLDTLPPNWYRSPAPSALQRIGDRWATQCESVALVVPSAVARIENNVLLNPAHPAFARLTIGTPCNIPVDARLRGRSVRS